MICHKFFLEDHLTPYISNLAYQCRCLKRERKIVQTKVIKGSVKILMSTHDGTLKRFDILHIEDIKGHFPDFVIHYYVVSCILFHLHLAIVVL